MIPIPAGDGRDGYVPHPGGAVFNTAIALGRLGVRAGMLTGLSRDMFGRQLAAALRASHVDVSHVITSDRPTTLAFLQFADGQAGYHFFDENSAGRMLSPADMPVLSGKVSALYFGGISLACEPGAETYESLLDLQGGGRTVMIDPNIRPGFIRDPADYRARLDRMLSRADIVKVSDADLNWIRPDPASLHAKADTILELGPSLVILTRGRDGAAGYLASGAEVQVPAIPVRVADTVGAGDAFNAGVLAGLSGLGLLRKDRIADLSADALTQAMDLGARVAAATVARAGANPPWAEEM